MLGHSKVIKSSGKMPASKIVQCKILSLLAISMLPNSTCFVSFSYTAVFPKLAKYLGWIFGNKKQAEKRINVARFFRGFLANMVEGHQSGTNKVGTWAFSSWVQSLFVFSWVKY